MFLLKHRLKPALCALCCSVMMLGVTSPSATAQDSALPRVRFNKQAARPTPALRVISLQGRELQGRVVGWARDGFALDPARGAIRDVTWSQLSAEDCFALQGQLIAQRREGQAGDCLELGRHLISRKREPGARLLGERALAKAVQFDPALKDDVAEILAEAPEPPGTFDALTAADVTPSPPAPIPDRSTVPHGVIPDGFKGTWPIEVEPYEVAQRLKDAFAFGHYPSVQPGHFLDPQMMANRAVTEWTDVSPPTFRHGLYPDWWNIRNTTGDILWALDQNPPAELFEAGARPLRLYAQRLAEGDPEMGRYLAEVYVRACSDDRLPEALELLAAMYLWSGDEASLNRMLRERLSFRPLSRDPLPEARRLEAFQNGTVKSDDVAGLLRNASAAVLRADDRTAKRYLEQLDLLGLDKAQTKKVDVLYARLLRITRGIEFSLRADAYGRRAVEIAFARIEKRQQVWEAGTPLAERLDPLPLEEVLGELHHELAVFGAHSSTAADRLLYLLEKRQWSGLEFNANTLYPLAFFINKYYDPARAVAPYILTQKAGCLRTPFRDFRGDYFAAAECGIYLQRCFEDHEKLLNHPDAWELVRPVIALAAELCNDPTAADAGHTHAWEHRYMANYSLISFDLLFSHGEASEALMQEQLENMPPGYTRQFIRRHYITYLTQDANDFDRAVAQATLMAQGVDAIDLRHSGVEMLQRWSLKHDRPDLWILAGQLARKAQEDVRLQVERISYRNFLLQELQVLIDAKKPAPTRPPSPLVEL